MNLSRKVLMKATTAVDAHRDRLVHFIAAFVKKNPKADDATVHSWAARNGMDKHKVEEGFYRLAGALLAGGNSFGSKKAYDAEQLRRGIEVEMEHLDRSDPFAILIATKIASDHLEENPMYYTWLDWMEGLAKQYKTPDEYLKKTAEAGKEKA